MTIEVGFLEFDNGKCPYLEWEKKLDKNVRAEIRVRINRIRIGNFGDCKAIQGSPGLYEMRVHLNSGYRIYYGKAKDKFIILLCAGNKASQKKDIERAKQYWLDYKKINKKVKNEG